MDDWVAGQVNQHCCVVEQVGVLWRIWRGWAYNEHAGREIRAAGRPEPRQCCWSCCRRGCRSEECVPAGSNQTVSERACTAAAPAAAGVVPGPQQPLPLTAHPLPLPPRSSSSPSPAAMPQHAAGRHQAHTPHRGGAVRRDQGHHGEQGPLPARGPVGVVGRGLRVRVWWEGDGSNMGLMHCACSVCSRWGSHLLISLPAWWVGVWAGAGVGASHGAGGEAYTQYFAHKCDVLGWQEQYRH